MYYNPASVITILSFIAAMACTSCISNTAKTPGSSTDSTYKLVWGDEFDYSGFPARDKWNYDTGGHGWGNQELQYYTAERKENVRVDNGSLIIEARKEPWLGSQYTSARLISKGKAEWKYGKVEVRAKLPSGRGTWPAIWMLAATSPMNWPDDGEIDIMEHVGFDHGRVHGSVHCKKYYHSIGTQKTASLMVPDCATEFHVYSTEWDGDSLRISVDDRVFFRFANEHTGYDAWPFDNKMYLLLNVAVGGGWGGQKGVDESVFPKSLEIDYVRVYQKK